MNATSVGSGGPDEELEVDWGSLRPGVVVADAVVSRNSTHLIRTAVKQGCIALNGLGILVNQGAISVRLWTGEVANRGVMRWALEKVLGVEGGD